MAKIKQLKFLYLLMAIVLASSLVAHLIDFDHHHPEGFFGEGFTANMHSEERKLWFVLLSVTLLLSGIITSIIDQQFKNFGRILEQINAEAKSFNQLVLFFSSGLLNPRLYE
jgi:hypothetical protein